MDNGAFSSTEKERAIEALQAIGLAQQNASLLLKELRMKCKQYCLDGEFLIVQAAFAEAERVAAQELRKLKAIVKPLPTPSEAVDAYVAAVASGEPEGEAREELREVQRAWMPAQPDRRMRAAGDHSLDAEVIRA
jgi:hypothetical protein